MVEQFVEAYFASFVDINTVEALFELLLIPFFLGVCAVHKFLEETAALIQVQFTVTVSICFSEYRMD